MTPQPSEQPRPDYIPVDGFKSRRRELAQAFREAVSVAHDYAAKHPRPYAAKPHRLVEDDDYNCDNHWCVRFWSMVREAEDEAEAAAPDPVASPLDVERLHQAFTYATGQQSPRHTWNLVAAEYARLEGQPVAEEPRDGVR